MLKREDVPDGWEWRRRLGVETARALEMLTLGHLNEMQDAKGITYVEWVEIENTEGERVIARIAPAVPHSALNYSIRAALIVGAKDSGIQRRELLQAPLPALAQAANARANNLLERLVTNMRQIRYVYDSPLTYENSDLFFEEVADRWLHAYEEGDPSPTDHIMRAGNVSKQTAQRWVTQARKRGFIPAGLTGKPGRR